MFPTTVAIYCGILYTRYMFQCSPVSWHKSDHWLLATAGPPNGTGALKKWAKYTGAKTQSCAGNSYWDRILAFSLISSHCSRTSSQWGTLNPCFFRNNLEQLGVQYPYFGQTSNIKPWILGQHGIGCHRQSFGMSAISPSEA